jgi:hypothetical protein
MRWDGIPPNNLEGGWHPPNEQVSRVDALAVASPNIGGVRFLGLEGLTPAGIFPGGSKWAGSEFMPCIQWRI